MKYVIGIDVGGTNIKMGIFSVEPFNLLDKVEFKTPKENQKLSIFNDIETYINKIVEKNKITLVDVIGVGLAVPCPVKDGYVSLCPNVNWKEINIIDSLRIKLPNHIHIVVSNDANIAAYGENYSLDHPHNNAILYTFGTGVGGGIILNGKIVEGRTGSGGEIGHMPIFETDEVCGCGKKGCLEQKSGTNAILKMAQEYAKKHPTVLNIDNLTVKDVFDSAKKNDVVGLMVLNEVSKYIALSMSILAVTLDPDVFIIGGGIAKAGDILVKKISENYKKFARFGTYDIQIMLAKTGNDAGIIGAARYALN